MLKLNTTFIITLFTTLILLSPVESYLRCYLGIPNMSPVSIKASLSRICEKRNIKYPGMEVWGLEKIRKPFFIGSGSFGTIYKLNNNEVYKEMIVQDTENYQQLYSEINASGCLLKYSDHFANGKDCYFFTESQSNKITIWMKMNYYPFNMMQLIKSGFKPVLDAINSGGRSFKTLDQWKADFG